MPVVLAMRLRERRAILHPQPHPCSRSRPQSHPCRLPLARSICQRDELAGEEPLSETIKLRTRSETIKSRAELAGNKEAAPSMTRGPQRARPEALTHLNPCARRGPPYEGWLHA